MPFRSEDEQLREQIRRIDEQVRETREEQARLEKEIHAHDGRARSAWGRVLLVAVAACAGTGSLAFKVGEVAAEQRAALRLEELNRELGRNREGLQEQYRSCSSERVQASEQRSECEREISSLRAPSLGRGGLR